MPFTFALLSCFFATLAIGQWVPTPATAVQPDTVPGLYIVQLSQGSLNKRDGQTPKDVIHNVLTRRDVSFTMGYDFGTSSVFTGASVQLDSPAGLAALAATPNVINIWPVRYWKKPPNNTKPPDPSANPAPDIQSSHQASGIDKLHAQGYLGQGVQVAVIDSGVDYNLPVLGGGFGPGYKVNKGWDFVGNNFNGVSGAQPGPDPMDTCDGHGTVTSSVIAGNYNATYDFIGVAPDANISAYRVTSCGGSTNDQIVLAAMQRAFQDGCDVMNLSIGANNGWTEEILGATASRIASMGVTVVASTGNYAEYGGFFPTSPGVGINVIDVGCIETQNFLLQSLNVSTGYGPIPYFSITSLPVSGALPIFVPSNLNACTAINAPPGNPANYVYVVVRGPAGCTFTTKIQNVQAVGGQVVLIVNTDPGLQAILLPTGAAAALISSTDGQYLISQFNAGNKITLTFPASQLVTIPNIDTAGLISSYVSYGPTDDLYLKPNVAAAGGGEVVVSYPANLGGWTTAEGTSISTPIVSGSAALLLQARGNTAFLGQSTTSLAQSIFEQTAVAANTATDDSGPIATLTQQGAGLINAYSAVHTQTYISPSKLFLNDTKYPQYYQLVTLHNLSGNKQTYSVAHQPAQTILTFSGGQANITPTFSNASATVTMSASQLTVPGGGSVPVLLTFTPPTGLDPTTVPVYTGQIVFTSSSDRVVASYQGVAAAMYNIPVIDDTNYYTESYKLPALVDNQLNPQTGPSTWNISSGNYPTLEYRLPIGSAVVQIDLISSSTAFTPTFSKREVQAHRGSAKHKAAVRRSNLDPTAVTTPETGGESKRGLPVSPSLSLGGIVSALESAIPQLEAVIPSLSNTLSWLIPSTSSSSSSNTFGAVPVVGTLFRTTYAARNVWDEPNSGGLYTYALSSRTFPNGRTFPPGSYRILLRALKVTGNPLNEADYQSWLSPVITITG